MTNKKIRAVLILLTLTMAMSLFNGCQTEEQPPNATPATAQTSSPTAAPATSAATAEPGLTLPVPADLPHAGDNLATDADGVIKYSLRDDGYGIFPSENYSYELPLTTNRDNVLSMYYFLFDPTLQTTDTMRDMPYQTYIRDKTGVNIDYLTMAFDAIGPAFQLALASDDLPDMALNPTMYYTAGSQMQLIDEGFIVNLNDYRAYLPNYLYQIPRYDYDMDMVYQYFPYPDVMVAIWGYYENPTPDMANMFRGDILDNLGIDINTITTYDKLHDTLVRIQTELDIEHPMQLYGPMIEGWPGALFSGMNTSIYIGSGIPYSRIDHGKVVYTLTEAPDLKAATLLSNWISDGLIDPNWQDNSGTTNNTRGAAAINGNNVFAMIPPATSADMVTQSGVPGYRWDAAPNIAETENYEFRYARGMKPYKVSFASWGISAKSKNIPLAITYGDYFYSDEGKFDLSWGVEGISYYYDESGSITLTDFILERPTTKLVSYAGSHFIEVGLVDRSRMYAYPEGRRLREMVMAQVIPGYPLKGSNDWPSTAAIPTDEERKEIAALQGDIGTFINENFTLFITGSKPFSEWDAYVGQVYSIGLGRVRDIYQGVYDRFIADYPEYKQPDV